MRKGAAAAVLSGLLLLAACTDDSDNGADAPKAGETSGEEASGSDPSTTVSFGEPHKFEDGVAIEVSRPKAFRPSANATTGGEPDYVRFNVTLVNDTDRPISTDQVSVTVESGDGQAGDVIDRRKGLTGSPSQRVAPGKAATWALGFGVLDPRDVRVEAQVGMEREAVTIGAD